MTKASAGRRAAPTADPPRATQPAPATLARPTRPRSKQALTTQAKQLAGIDDPAKLAKATCTPVDDAFDCLASGASKQQAVRLVLAPDGTLSKRLAGSTGALKTSAEVADALAADNQARGVGEAVNYGCATSVRTEADGTQQPGTATGYLCFGSGENASNGGAPQGRYVEPGNEGTLLRDYLVQPPSAG